MQFINKIAMEIWNDETSLKLVLAALALMDIYARGGDIIITLAKLGITFKIAEWIDTWNKSE